MKTTLLNCMLLVVICLLHGCGEGDIPPTPAVKAAATAEILPQHTKDQPYQVASAKTAKESTIAENNESTVPRGFGSISGQFVLDGPIPEKRTIIRKGDSAVEDSECCAAQELFARDLVVDEQSKGIRHIFVYMRRAEVIHPDLRKSTVREVVFDQKHCRFEPHTMLIRTDQTVVLKSDDPIVHNVHWTPIRNQSFNVLLAMNERQGKNVSHSSIRLRERHPVPVKCDMHPWMKAYWLLLDHPYMAITNSDGKFRIEKVPAGVHEITVWHERIGYLDTKEDADGNSTWIIKRKRVDWTGRRCTVTVNPDSVTDFGQIEIPSVRFEDSP